MLPNKIQIKLFTQSAVDLKDLIPVFHRWIQEEALEGLIIDVADYRHVPHGPGLLLMGHEGDYALDLANGRPGIVYKHKRDWPADANDLQDRITLVLQRVRQAAQLLNDQTAWVMDDSEVEIRFPDRLTAPNTAESFTELKAALTAAAEPLFGQPTANVRLASTDPRHSLAVVVEIAPAAVHA